MTEFPYRRLAIALSATLIFGSPSLAQKLDAPFNTYCPPDPEIECFGRAEVMGLDPNGDGFLAVRTGPGSQYRKISEIHNGDVVVTYGHQGKWWAIGFGSPEKLGWAHGNWLGNHAP